MRLIVGISLAAALVAACNAIYGVDELEHTGKSAAASGGSSAVGGGGGGGNGGETASSSGSAGGGGNGGSGGATEQITVTLSERPGADLSKVTEDTELEQSVAGDNDGAGVELTVDAQPPRTALFRFDLSSLTNVVSVVSAALELRTSDCNDCGLVSGEVRVFTLLESWTEGNQTSAPGVSNWNERHSMVPWTAAGAGLGSRNNVAIGTFAPRDMGTFYTVQLDPSVVQGWLDDPSSNFGVAMTPGLGTAGDQVVFRSSNHATADHRPQLTIVANVPLAL